MLSTTSRLRFAFCASAVTSVLLFNSAAAAQQPPPQPAARASGEAASGAGQLAEEGSTLYKAREYKAALAKFKQAYAVDNDPNLLYNIARCQEALGDLRAAQENYETFVAQPGGDSEGKAKAQAALQRLRNARSSAPTSGASPTPSGSTQPAEQEGPHKGGPYGALAIVSLGVAVVAAGVGTIFYALGASDHSKVTSSPGYNQPNAVDPMTEKAAQDLVDSGTTKKTIGVVGWTVGGVALATSGIFLLVGASATKEKRASVHRPMLGAAPTRGGMSAVLTGSF